MDISQASSMQVLDTNRSPFKDNILDYSQMDNASILDAFAASFLLLSVTAVVTHFAALLLGMTTRSVVVSSLLEKYLFPNIFCIFRIRSGKPENTQGKKMFFTSQIIAGCFLSVLLFAEAIVILSSSSSEINISLEDLQIRWPQISPYEGALRFREVSDNCYFFYSSKRSLSVNYLSFCLHRHLPVKSNRSSDEVRVFLEQSFNSLFVVYGCDTNMQRSWLHMVIPVQLSLNATGINSNQILPNGTATIIWLGKRIQPILNCDSITNSVGRDGHGDLVYQATLKGCKNVSETSCESVVDKVMLSTLHFSNSSISREDFIQQTFANDNVTQLPSKKPADINWDEFGSLRRSRIPGYIIWLNAFFFFFLNIILGACAPDLQYVRQIAASQQLQLETIPAGLKIHKGI